MATKVKGITIEIGANTTALSTALKNVNKQISGANVELKEINKLLKFDSSNVVLLKQKQEILNAAIKGTVEKLEKLNLAKKQADESGKVDKNSESYRQLERAIAEAEQSLKSYNVQAEENTKLLDDSSKGVKTFGDNVEDASKKTSVFGDVLKANLATEIIKKGIDGLIKGIKNLMASLKDWEAMYQNLEEQEQKFRTALQNTTDATEEDIQAYVKLAEAKEKNGVVSKAAILNGYQELATYTTQKESIEKLTDAMLDMTVQQYGMNASEEQTLSIATRLGKALSNGDYSGLAKMGYYFTDAQKQAMKLGTEEDRVNALLEAITGSVGGMNEALAQTNAGKVRVATSYIDDMKVSIGKLSSEVKNNLLAEFLPAIKEVSEAVQQMASGDVSVEEGMSKVVEGIKKGVEKAIEFLPKVIEIGAEIILKLIEGIINAIPVIIPALVQVINTIVQKLIELLPSIIQVGFTIIIELIKGITEAIPTLIPTIVNVVYEITETIIDNLPAIVMAAVDLVVALGEGIIDALPLLLEKIPDVITDLVMALTDPEMLAKIIEGAIKLGIAIAKGIVQSIPQIIAIIPNIIKQFQMKFKERIENTDWLSLGRNILKGILNGMLDFGNIVKDTIKKVGSKITSSIKNFFGIKSPSKVMKDQVGKYLAQGIAVGFEKEIPNTIDDVQNAMSNLTNKVQASVNPTINPTANSNPLIIQIENFNNTRGTDIEALAEELEYLRKNSALAVGGN